MLGVVEVARSSRVTPTIRSVLIGFEYPIKDTPFFYAKKGIGVTISDFQPLRYTEQLYLVFINIILNPCKKKA